MSERFVNKVLIDDVIAASLFVPSTKNILVLTVNAPQRPWWGPDCGCHRRQWSFIASTKLFLLSTFRRRRCCRPWTGQITMTTFIHFQ